MKEVLILIVLSGMFFLGFVIMLIAGLVRKRKSIVIISLAALLLCAGFISRTVYLVANKSLNKAAGLFRPRTGDEIYRALFGEPSGCVKVVNAQDQEFPVLDIAIWLETETCPGEVRRILRQHGYIMSIRTTGDEPETGSRSLVADWFNPVTLGDSVRVFVWEKDGFANKQIIYLSADSTRMFCEDIAD